MQGPVPKWEDFELDSHLGTHICRTTLLLCFGAWPPLGSYKIKLFEPIIVPRMDMPLRLCVYFYQPVNLRKEYMWHSINCSASVCTGPRSGRKDYFSLRKLKTSQRRCPLNRTLSRSLPSRKIGRNFYSVCTGTGWHRNVKCSDHMKE